MVWPGCNWGRKWTRLSPAQRVVVARSDNPAIGSRLRLMASASTSCSETPPGAITRNKTCLISRHLEVPIEEIAGRVISRQPMSVEQKIVHVIGENELFDLDAFFAATGDEVHGITEDDLALVVTVNEKHRRRPGVHRGHGRRIMRQPVQLRGDILSVPIVGGPVMNAMQVHACGERIGIAPQA